MDEKIKTELELAEEARAARKAAKNPARDAQKTKDTIAISKIEEELGDEAVKAIDVPFYPGHVTKVAVRTPNPAEMKRYRDMTKITKQGKPGDAVAAHELLASSCRVYPSESEYDALCELLTGLRGQCGVHAVALSVGEAEAEGKG